MASVIASRAQPQMTAADLGRGRFKPDLPQIAMQAHHFRQTHSKLPRFTAVQFLKFAPRDEPTADEELDRVFDPTIEWQDCVFTQRQQISDGGAGMADGDRDFDRNRMERVIGVRVCRGSRAGIIHVRTFVVR